MLHAVRRTVRWLVKFCDCGALRIKRQNVDEGRGVIEEGGR
jgi:hypothetical protein